MTWDFTHNVDPSEVDSVVSSLIGTKPENKYAFHPVNDVSKVVDFSKKFYSDANIGALLRKSHQVSIPMIQWYQDRSSLIQVHPSH